MAELLNVTPAAHMGERVCLYEKDKAHPDGEVMISGQGTVWGVGDTPAVRSALHPDPKKGGTLVLATKEQIAEAQTKATAGGTAPAAPAANVSALEAQVAALTAQVEKLLAAATAPAKPLTKAEKDAADKAAAEQGTGGA